MERRNVETQIHLCKKSTHTFNHNGGPLKTSLAFICSLFFIPILIGAQDSKTLVHSAWEHLDSDADYFSVMRPQKAIDTLMELGPKMAGGMMAGFGPEPEDVVKQGRQGMQKSGMDGLSTMGFSHKKLADHSEARVFLGRAPGAAGPMWEVLPPRDNVMAGIRFLPASSAVCSYGNIRPGKLIEIAKAFMPAETAGELNSIVEEHPMSGLPQFSALQGDWGAALTLHPTRTMPSPSGEGPDVPELGFVLIADAGSDFFDFIKEQMGETSPTSIGGASGLKAKAIPLPFKNEPHLFRTEKRVVLASSAELASEVRDNLSGTGKGLLGNNDFRSFATAFTAKSTFFSYVSPQAGKVLSGLQEDSGMDMEDMFGPAGGLLKLEQNSSGLSSVQATEKGLAYRVKYKGFGGAVPLAGLAPLGVAMMLPAASGMEQIMAGKVLTETKINGRLIYTAIYADMVDENLIGYPQLGEYKSSTEYFKTLAGKRAGQKGGLHKVLAQPDILAGYQKAAPDWDRFTAANNGWCVITGADENTDPGMPFMFSANLLNDEISSDTRPEIDPNTRFGDKIVVVLHGGGVSIIDPEDPDFWPNFHLGFTYKQNAILRP